MPIIEGAGKAGVGLGTGRRRLAVALYDFAVDGGAQGAITLRGDTIPSGAIITDTLIHVDTALTSGGSATVSLGAETATGIQAATAIGSSPWSTTGPKHGAALTATTAPVKTTAQRSVTATIAVADLTAGKFSVYVSYIEIASH